jgi:hypothetical protein
LLTIITTIITDTSGATITITIGGERHRPLNRTS